MASILLGKLRTLLAIVAVLLLLVACGAAETGGAESAPSAQPAITRAATAEPTAQPAPTVAPTQTSASATEPGGGTAVAIHGGPVKDQVSLLDSLRKAGATVQVGEQTEQPFLSVAGTQLTINGVDMQVFEYAGEAAAQADAAKTADILAGRGTMMIDWVGSPHAYRAGRVIVLYVGDDAATLQLLQETLGAPFAEQQLRSSPQPSTAPTASSSTATESRGAVSDRAGFVDRLRADGLDVKSAGEVQQPFFEVPGTGLTVNGADVQVFEFADAAAAKGAVSKIGADGNPQGTIIEWVAPPHFYQAGRIVVLYVGEDKAIIEALTKTLGAQVAGR